jgi:membrane-bound lytic murein transglycosylase B
LSRNCPEISKASCCDDGEEHWVGFHNFFVITRYNRSVMYALAVHQLGQEIAIEVKRGEI